MVFFNRLYNESEEKPFVGQTKADDSVKQYKAQTTNKNTNSDESVLLSNRKKVESGSIGRVLREDAPSTIGEDETRRKISGDTSNDAINNDSKKQTIGDVTKSETKSISLSMRKNQEAERKLLKAEKYLPTALKVGGGIITAATLLDIGGAINDKREEKKMKAATEKQIREREKKEKDAYKQYSYGYVDSGEILFELFNNRSGHHKMGNAKFY